MALLQFDLLPALFSSSSEREKKPRTCLSFWVELRKIGAFSIECEASHAYECALVPSACSLLPISYRGGLIKAGFRSVCLLNPDTSPRIRSFLMCPYLELQISPRISSGPPRAAVCYLPCSLITELNRLPSEFCSDPRTINWKGL